MKAIHINEHTLNYIAKTHNDGVVPELEGDSYYTRSYYLVKDDGPNEIVSAKEFISVMAAGPIFIETRPPRK